MLCLAGVVTWYTSLLLASLDRHDGVRCAGGRSRKPPEDRRAMHLCLPPCAQAYALLRPGTIDIRHAQRLPGPELSPRYQCPGWLTCVRKCAGMPGYWAVIFFQQLASVGNNLTVQIVAGQCMKVRGLHRRQGPGVKAVYAFLGCFSHLAALMDAGTCLSEARLWGCSTC
jgi:hypothetical protein